jgi:hypothetical protein
MSKIRFSTLFSVVDPRALRHGAARTARASGAALVLALAPGSFVAGCSNAHDTAPQVHATGSLDAWLGRARSPSGVSESTFDVQLDAEARSPDAPERSRFLRLAGIWTFTQLSGAGGQVLARLKLTRLELSDDHALPIGREQYRSRIQAEIERAVLFDLNERGAIVGMHAPLDLVSTARGAIQMLAASFQLTIVPSGQGESWRAEEQDASGTYAAEYRLLSENAIARKKLRYTEVPPVEEGSTPVKYEIQKSEARFELSPAGAIASCTGAESLVLDDQEGALPRLETKTTFRIARKSDTLRKEVPEQAAELRALPARALNAAPEPEAMRYELDLAKAAGGTRIDNILADMARTDPARGAGDPHAFRRLVASLAAAVRIDEDADDVALSQIDAGGPYTAELLTALARSNRPKTLLKVVQKLRASSRLAPELRARGLMALSKNASVDRSVVDAIEALTTEPRIGDGAVLGLGALSYRLRRTNPMLSQQIYESLAARLERATTYQQTELVLRAIGNAGNDAALPKIERFLANPNPKLRAIAVAALRRLEDPAVKILLAEVEKNDPDETVQDALRGVLLMRERT